MLVQTFQRDMPFLLFLSFLSHLEYHNSSSFFFLHDACCKEREFLICYQKSGIDWCEDDLLSLYLCKIVAFPIVYTLDVHSFFPSKIRGGGFLVFKIWTKRGLIEKLLRNRGLVKRGGGLS